MYSLQTCSSEHLIILMVHYNFHQWQFKKDKLFLFTVPAMGRIQGTEKFLVHLFFESFESNALAKLYANQIDTQI